MDAEVTISDQPEPIRPPGAEPCERCGQLLVVLDVFQLAAQLLGLDPPDQVRLVWHEVHTRTAESPDGAMVWATTYRPHTDERCARVRAGKPEPLDPLDDTDDSETPYHQQE